MARSFTAQVRYLFAVRGTPQHIRSKNDPEFVAKTVRRWLRQTDVGRLLIAKGSPSENSHVESAGGMLCDKLLNQDPFLSLVEDHWVIGHWRLDYDHNGIQSALDYQNPAAYAIGCVLPDSATPPDQR